MKKIFSISAIITILISFLPIMQASALVTDTQLDAITCADQSIVGTWDQKQAGTCDDLDDSPQTIRIEGSWTGYTADIVLSRVIPVHAKLVCVGGGSGCLFTHDVYYRVTASIYNSSSIDFSLLPYKGWKIAENYSQPPPYDGLLEVQKTTGTVFSTFAYDGKISKEELRTQYMNSGSPWHVALQLYPLGDHLQTGYISWNYVVVLSMNPIDDDCLDNYLNVGDGQSFTVQATNSSGVALAIDPTRTYKVTISGGPWRDGGAAPDRYDAAYSYDNVNWAAVGGIANQCASSSEQTGGGTTYSFILPQDVNLTTVAFRVNDTGGTWTNNTGSLTVTITEVTALTNCASQYSYTTGDPVASGTVQANVSSMTAANNLTTGNYYVIETTSGHWHNGSDPTELYTLQVKGPNSSDQWGALGTYSNSNCAAAAGSYTRVYFQAGGANLYLRVNDPGGNFSDNTGSISYVIYTATFTRFPDLCESLYKVGNVIETKYVPGNGINGIQMNTKGSYKFSSGGGDLPKITKWLAIDTVGGPWFDSTSNSNKYDGDLGKTVSGSVSWSLAQQFPYAACVAKLDGLGHYRIYWQAADADNYWFRVHDTDFSGNTGQLGYTLYEASSTAIDNSTFPEAGTCDADFSKSTVFWQRNVNGTFASGELLTGYTPGEMIAITTHDGPWNDGTMNLYDTSISDDNGATWHELWDYDGVSCAQSADGYHVEVWLTTQAGRIYKIRVSDSAGTFSNNTGSITVKAWHATNDIDPWTTCADSYSMRLINLTGGFTDFIYNNIPVEYWFDGTYSTYANPIDVHLENGLQIGGSALNTGKTYALMTVFGPWHDLPSTDDRYDADISADNGTTWTIIGTGTEECTVKVRDSYYMTYFTIQSGEQYRIRVHDDGGLVDFASNSGNLKYYLFAASTDPGSNGDGTVPDWSLSCTVKCTRPTSILDVGGWLEYFRCQFTYFISWCPEHTAALGYLKSVFTQREPFGTINAITGWFNFARTEVAAYDWEISSITDISNVVEGGDSGIQSPLSIVNGLQANSPWLGGQITYQETAQGGQSSVTTCTTNLVTILGGNNSEMSKGYCFVINILKIFGITAIITVIVIVANVLIFLEYIQNRWLHKLGY